MRPTERKKEEAAPDREEEEEEGSGDEVLASEMTSPPTSLAQFPNSGGLRREGDQGGRLAKWLGRRDGGVRILVAAKVARPCRGRGAHVLC